MRAFSVAAVVLVGCQVVPPDAQPPQPCLSVSRELVEFAPSTQGCRAPVERVRFVNGCAFDVPLRQVITEPFGLISSPAVVPANGSVEAELSLDTHAAGLHTGTVTWVGGEQRGVLTLSANVLEATPVEETQIVPDVDHRLDVGFVIDDSAALAPLESSLKQNLERHLLTLKSWEFDTRVAVLSTSLAATERGHLRTSTAGAWLTNPGIDALWAHGALRFDSVAASSCLEALSSLADHGFEGLLRPGAALQVVCITNSPEALEHSAMEVTSTLLRAFPTRVRYSLIARFSDGAGCTGDLQSTAMLPLVELTSGTRDELCTPNWATSLPSGVTAFGWKTLYYLQGTPDLLRAPLGVSVEGVELPGSTWEWDGALNAVRLSPILVPTPGQTLRFTYLPACAP